MTAHLLAIALGPVQDFIASARRTRDLWFGSFLLSEISKAAARAVRDKGKLIFPNPTNPDRDLKPESAFNVVNIIVAELPEGLLPKDIATVAGNAAKECWKGYAATAKTVADALLDKTTRSGKTLWEEQIEDVVEFYAAWAPLKSEGGYSGARRELMLLLAGRKALRNFKFHRGEPKIPKSSLDGARESVLIQNATSNQSTPAEHRNFSRQLALFAGDARNIVKAHHGCLVYSGGDDILAFVPVDRCVDCARALHDRFGDLLKDYEDDTGQPPTLSVGIAIGHCQEPLEDLLQYARDAEKNAKEPDRNGLAVHLHTRGGPPVCVRAPWVGGPDAQQSLDKRLLKWAGMHLEEQLSDKAVYDLRELATEYAGWPRSAQTDQAIKKDIARLLSRKKAGGEKLDTNQFNKELEACFTASERVNVEQQDTFLDHHPGVMRLATEWLVARKIARVMRQAQRKKASTHEGSQP